MNRDLDRRLKHDFLKSNRSYTVTCCSRASWNPKRQFCICSIAFIAFPDFDWSGNLPWRGFGAFSSEMKSDFEKYHNELMKLVEYDFMNIYLRFMTRIRDTEFLCWDTLHEFTSTGHGHRPAGAAYEYSSTTFCTKAVGVVWVEDFRCTKRRMFGFFATCKRCIPNTSAGPRVRGYMPQSLGLSTLKISIQMFNHSTWSCLQCFFCLLSKAFVLMSVCVDP